MDLGKVFAKRKGKRIDRETLSIPIHIGKVTEAREGGKGGKEKEKAHEPSQRCGGKRGRTV